MSNADWLATCATTGSINKNQVQHQSRDLMSTREDFPPQPGSVAVGLPGERGHGTETAWPQLFRYWLDTL